MSIPRFTSVTDQVAEHLRAEIKRGRWGDTLPGKHSLAGELGVNNKTVEAALRQLEKAGLLVPRGAGRKRLISGSGDKAARALRITILLHEEGGIHGQEYQGEVHHALTDAGHTVNYAPKSLASLRFDPRRVAALVRQTRADAWIVNAGSREILEWFSQQSTPAFALFGHRVGLRIPSFGPDKTKPHAEVTRRLIGLGHRRIALLCRKIRRLPHPGAVETVFLSTLLDNGIRPSEFNLPDWDESNAGFQKCLEELFRVTPPTALIVDEAPYFVAVMQFLSRRGLRMPEDVSLVCTDDDPAFSRCEPPLTRIVWDSRPLVRRILNWVDNVRRGKSDLRQTMTPAVLLEGGTVARASHRSVL